MHLPDFPLELCSRGACTDEPFAIGEGEGREQRIVAANVSARSAGIRPGMRASEAHALTHILHVRPRDPTAEAEGLARLAAWSGRYTSFVSMTPPAALLLEVEGSRNIYGGLDRLIGHLRSGLCDLGYSARLALAPTALGATWLARSGREDRIVEHAHLFGALADLPLACLELDPKQEAMLKGLGLSTLIDCLRLPRDGIARRAGPDILDRLDRAFGRKPDPRRAFVPPEHFRARLGLPAPVTTHQALLFPLRRLLHELAGFLLARGLGATALEITLHAARSAATSLSLKLVTPSRDPQHLTGLVRERLERLMLTAPVEELTLAVNHLLPLASQPADFFAGIQTPDEMRAQMVERLQARLGREAVRGIAGHADHRPERAWRFVDPGAGDGAVENARRPLWLLPEPIPLALHDRQPYWEGALALEPECERIESGWWDGAEAARDYFVARHGDGRRFWIFRELRTPVRWFLHGVFG